MLIETENIKKLREKGYSEDFTSAPSLDVLFSENKVYKLHEFKIAAYYEYPVSGENGYNILYAIETYDGKKGLLLDCTGSYDEERISRFIHTVTEARIHRKRLRIFSSVQNLFKFRFSSNL
jgi:hypothetical protein